MNGTPVFRYGKGFWKQNNNIKWYIDREVYSIEKESIDDLRLNDVHNSLYKVIDRWEGP